jgi:methylglutaconyl-CoA hydratase
MIMTDPVLYKTENAVATITLNRPDVLNAFNEQVIEGLIKCFTKAAKDKDVRVVVLRGEGKSFCAGGDLNWMKRSAGYTRKENEADAARLGKLLQLIHALPKLTVALVQGNAYGGGVGLTACCDVAVAEEGAQFRLSEARIGLIPSIILPYVMAAMGGRQAGRWCLTAEAFDAAKAKEIGFVHEVAPKGGLDAAAQKIIAAALECAPSAQARGKKLMRAIGGKPIDAKVIKETVKQIAEARASAEGKEGVSAFLNKREPAWRKK